MSCRQQIDRRTRCYQLLAIGKKQLGWDEDTYRDFLAGHGAKEKAGKYSATTMSIDELEQAVNAMKAFGFKPVRNRKKPTDWRVRMTNKITALWCALYDAGVVRNKSQIAMERWCRSITKVAMMRWYKPEHYSKCIEGLKSWAKREQVEIRD